MMGHQATGREQLFYTFSMEDHAPEDHLLRGIHKFLDLSSFRQHLKPFYSPIGRPSIDAELMIRMLIVGYRSIRPSGVTWHTKIKPLSMAGPSHKSDIAFD
jgi:transposase